MTTATVCVCVCICVCEVENHDGEGTKKRGRKRKMVERSRDMDDNRKKDATSGEISCRTELKRQNGARGRKGGQFDREEGKRGLKR